MADPALPPGFRLVDQPATAAPGLPPGFVLVQAAPQDSSSVPGGMLRSVASGATMGFDDEIVAGIKTGFGYLGDYGTEVESQRKAKKDFADAHPYLDFAGNVAGALPTMFVPGMGAARAINAGRTAATTGQFVRHGAVTGAKYGGVAGIGNADPRAEAGDTAIPGFGDMLQRVLGGVGGAAIGGAAGGAIGLGAKAVNQVGRTLGGAFRDGAEAAGMLEGGAAGVEAARRQSLRDIAMELRRDRVDPEQLVRGMLPDYRAGQTGTLSAEQIERAIGLHLDGRPATEIATELGVTPGVVQRMIGRFDEEIRPRYEGQNLLETIRTPRTDNQVMVTPNTVDLAHVAATSEGRGRQVMMQTLRQRQADMGDEAADIIDRTFGSAAFDDYARRFGDETQTLSRELYRGLHAGTEPVVRIGEVPALQRLQQDPLFQRAVDFAVRDARLRDGDEIAAAIANGDLTPRAVDMIQRQLRLAGQSLSDPNAAGLANNMRARLLSVAEDRMPTFWGARGWYRNRVTAEEALEMGRSLGMKTGNSGSEAWQTWQRYGGRDGLLANIDSEIADLQRQIGLTPTGRASRAGPRAGGNALPDMRARLETLTTQREQIAAVVDNFRRAFGQGLKDFLDRGGNADSFLKGAEARVFRTRVEEILGRDAGPFLAEIDRMIRQKATTGHLYGNSETAPRTAKRASLNALMDTAAGIATLNPMRAVRGATDMMTNRLREARYDRINEMLSETDLREVFRLAQVLRNHMARSQLPSSPRAQQTVLSIVDRLPAPLRDSIRNTLGNEVRGNDLLTILSGILGNERVQSTFEGAR